MALHLHSQRDEFAAKFLQASERWNLEKLYQDIVNVKQQERIRNCKQLTPTQKACLRGLCSGYSPTEIAVELKREPNGLRVELSRGLYRHIETLTGSCVRSWSNVAKLLENQGYKCDPSGGEPTDKVSKIYKPEIQHPKTHNQVDWGEAIDVSFWCDRTLELSTLQQWIIQDRCRIVTLLGIGGIGKTALSVKFAQLVQNGFDFVIWRTLRDTPTLDELLTNLIKFLSQQQEVNLPQNIGAKISLLIEYLRKFRCLLLLDNFDALLSGAKRAGCYRDGYEEYGELLQRLGEVTHQSCLLLTSREKPAEVAALQGNILPIRVLQLDGLSVVAARNILTAKGLFGSEDEIKQLVESYRGNPLALKIAATSIVDLFDGSIADFLQQGTTVFNGIRNLLSRHFQRLSPLEEKVMYWLAINREPVQAVELESDIYPAVSRANLLETLESLTWRCLIEKGKDAKNRVSTFTQQPLVMEYVTDLLVADASEEIKTGKIELLNKYALIKVTSKD